MTTVFDLRKQKDRKRFFQSCLVLIRKQNEVIDIKILSKDLYDAHKEVEESWEELQKDKLNL